MIYITNEVGSAELVMIISYPASPSFGAKMSKYMIDNADNGFANSLNEIERESSKGRNVNIWWSYKRKTLSRGVSYKRKLI